MDPRQNSAPPQGHPGSTTRPLAIEKSRGRSRHRFFILLLWTELGESQIALRSFLYLNTHFSSILKQYDSCIFVYSNVRRRTIHGDCATASGIGPTIEDWELVNS